MSSLTPPPPLFSRSPSPVAIERQKQTTICQQDFITSISKGLLSSTVEYRDRGTLTADEKSTPTTQRINDICYQKTGNTLYLKDNYSDQAQFFSFLGTIPAPIREQTKELTLDARRVKATGPLLTLFPNLTKLIIEQHIDQVDPGPVGSLEELVITKASALSQLDFIKDAGKLKRVTLLGPINLTSLDPLSKAPLNYLNIPDAQGLLHLGPLTSAVHDLRYAIHGMSKEAEAEFHERFPNGVEIKE